VKTQLKKQLKTKILVDGGDPEETRRMKSLIGVVDGQTTNPTLIARNPEIQRRIASDHKLSVEEQRNEYRRIVSEISPIVGDAGVSIEVFANLNSTAEQMLSQGEDMFSWIPNAYIKYPCTHEGLRAAKMSIVRGIRVNITLCFSQQQAAGVYAATRGSIEPVYVSPFIGRLDDCGDNGMDLITNIQRMYKAGDGHVHVLAASIRSVDQLLACFALGVDLVTVPAKVLEAWAAKDFPIPDKDFTYKGLNATGNALMPIPFRDINLNRPWAAFDLSHELTRKGVEKFVKDFESTLQQSAHVG